MRSARLPQRLVSLLAAVRPRALCQTCLAQSLDARPADVRASIRIALTTNPGIVVRRRACAHCREVGAVAMLKAA